MEHSLQTPQLHTHVNDDHTNVTVDIDLPGVEANKVRVRFHEDCFSLRAAGEDVRYETEFCFCCPVDRREIVTRFQNGRLHIEAPFRPPMTNARDITVGSRTLRTREPVGVMYPAHVDLLRQ